MEGTANSENGLNNGVFSMNIMHMIHSRHFEFDSDHFDVSFLQKHAINTGQLVVTLLVSRGSLRVCTAIAQVVRSRESATLSHGRVVVRSKESAQSSFRQERVT